MSLRLNTSNSLSSPLSLLEHDVNLSASTKADFLRFISVILKNLGKDDPKYRQLRHTTNSKIQKNTSYPAVLSYLRTIGFVETFAADDESVLKCSAVPSNLAALRREVSAAQERIAALQPAVISHSSSTASLVDNEATNLSERQKARKLAEENEAQQKLQAKAARKRTVDQIKADKWTRQNDPNWKPSVSAAAAKSGDSMQTFREKFGES